MVHHELAGSEYNRRREQCEDGVARLKTVLPDVQALRDVTAEDLARHGGLLSDVVLRRCRHVVTENDRVQRAAAALESGRVDEVGRLMGQSHVSMRDDYEISCREIDTLVELAERSDGVLGARMTGGGFGGCTINLVRVEAVERFVDEIGRGYKQATGIVPQFLVCRPGAGAGVAT
jgi:galactokinase